MTDASLEALVARVSSLEESLSMAWKLLYRVERKLLTSGMLLTLDDISLERKSELQVVKGVSNLLQDISPDFKLELKELDEAQENCCPMLAGTGPDDQKLN